MTVKSLILSFSISLLLVGCASEEDREKARQARFQADLAKAQESCLSIGFKSGTAEMPVCLQAQLNLISQGRADAYARRQAFYIGLQNAGKALQGSSSTAPSYKCKKDRLSLNGGFTCNPD